jgi:hypothetical protein
MTAIAKTIRGIGMGASLGESLARPFAARAAALSLLALTALAIPNGLALAGEAISDAYLSVSVFVASSMLVLHAAEGLLHTDLGRTFQRHRVWQVPAGAFLGGLPGCGGAIVAVTQFTRGNLSFGGLVATLTSTMGDAMFLLLAREPATAGVVFAIGLVSGIVTGYAVDTVHGARFMHPDEASIPAEDTAERLIGRLTGVETLWYVVLAPGLALGVADALQIGVGTTAAGAVGVAGGLLALGMWLVRGGEGRACRDGVCDLEPKVRKVVNDTNFVTAWVAFAFVGYEAFMAVAGVDLGAAFSVWAAAVPAIGILIGFIPGCGPQIVTTSLYLDGVIPLSAQLGNAISNDGDALFPAIAKAPRAAALATLYTTLPAILAAYLAYALGW